MVGIVGKDVGVRFSKVGGLLGVFFSVRMLKVVLICGMIAILLLAVDFSFFFFTFSFFWTVSLGALHRLFCAGKFRLLDEGRLRKDGCSKEHEGSFRAE